MSKTLFRSDDRGFANHGWLKTHHTFSFANYYRQDRMAFGNLRVFNDDLVEPGTGFGTHPHDNMEIISIPLEGNMAHKDSQGNEVVIKPGDIQVMSAGTGLTHSEYNASESEPLSFLQIWIIPENYNIEPTYSEQYYSFDNGILQPIARPDGKHKSLIINQQAFLSLGRFSKDTDLVYARESEENGVFVFLIEGKATIEGEKLHKRDAVGIENTDSINIRFLENTFVFIIDVPMKRN